MMNIHTVAAGGGSVLAFEGGRLRVGPRSAGSSPGPACYRNGGPLTVTDVQVLLGRIRPETFPAIFGPGGDQPLDAAIVRERSTRSPRPFRGRRADAPDAERLAAGFLDVAVESMARAIRHVSVREGHDPAEFALLCYGGAAPQHACRVADCARHRRDPDSSARRRAVGLGHRSRRPPADAAPKRRAAAHGETHAALDAEFAAMDSAARRRRCLRRARHRQKCACAAHWNFARLAPRRRWRSHTRRCRRLR